MRVILTLVATVHLAHAVVLLLAVHIVRVGAREGACAQGVVVCLVGLWAHNARAANVRVRRLPVWVVVGVMVWGAGLSARELAHTLWYFGTIHMRSGY